MVDRLPPHDMESEQALLGCILLDPRMVLPQLESKIKGREVFYDGRHQAIYGTMVEMSAANTPIDLVTLNERLKANGHLEAEGSISYLSALPDAAPSAWNFSYYLETVLDRFTKRGLLALAAETCNRVYEGESASETLDQVEKKLSDISRQVAGENNATMESLVDGAYDDLEAAYKRGHELTGLATGFPDLDAKTNGLKPGNMFVLAGRPSTGKTSLAINIAEHVATDLQIPVGIFSLEMTKEELAKRMLCARARVNERHMRDQLASDEDFKLLGLARLKLQTSPIHIDDTPGLNVMQMRARARRMVYLHGIKLLVVDYLQLMQAVTGKMRDRNNRQQEVADISNGIKSVLKELGIPGLILSQLNRELDKDKNRKPRLSDLRESGAIEQDADIIGMLYSPEDDPEHKVILPVNLLIAKQRNGPTGDVNLTFFREFTKFESTARVVDMPQENPQREFYDQG